MSETEHQKCYVYTPPTLEERAPKRQRTNKINHQAHLPERQQTYRKMWSDQEKKIKVRFKLCIPELR